MCIFGQNDFGLPIEMDTPQFISIVNQLKCKISHTICMKKSDCEVDEAIDKICLKFDKM